MSFEFSDNNINNLDLSVQIVVSYTYTCIYGYSLAPTRRFSDFRERQKKKNCVRDLFKILDTFRLIRKKIRLQHIRFDLFNII